MRKIWQTRDGDGGKDDDREKYEDRVKYDDREKDEDGGKDDDGEKDEDGIDRNSHKNYDSEKTQTFLNEQQNERCKKRKSEREEKEERKRKKKERERVLFVSGSLTTRIRRNEKWIREEGAMKCNFLSLPSSLLLPLFLKVEK